ncbi:hypothetical protein JCM5350_007962, partial [Sporobolomyces pararoseus]
MYRAGQPGGPGKSQAASGPFKPHTATAFSVPKEGGTSQHDRTDYNSSSSHGNRGRGRGGHSTNYGQQNRNAYRPQNVNFLGKEESNRWKGAGSNGFEPGGTGGGRGMPDSEPGRGYREEQNPLEDPRRKPQLPEDWPGKDMISQRNQERFREDFRKREQEKEARRRNLKEAAEKRQKEEEEEARMREEQDRRDREQANSFMAQNREADQRRRAARSASRSNSTTDSTAPRRATDKYKSKEPVNLAASILKSQAFLTQVGDGKEKDDSDDELTVVTLPASQKDRDREKEKLTAGKGKERAKDLGNRTDSKKEKKSRLGRIKGGGGFDDDEDDEPSRTNRPVACGGGGPTIAEMYASKEEGDEIDALIDRAEEEAKQAKKKETEEDSDLEIVDPSKSQEEEEGEEQDDDGDEGEWREALRDAEREETPDELLMTQRPAKIDPSTLCPFCDQPLPEEPSERLSSLKRYLLARPHIESRHSFRNPKAKYLPIVEIASFCQLHKVEKTVIPEGRAKGYPVKIDWRALPQRIEDNVAALLSEIITGESPSRFLDRAKQDWDRNNGFRRTNITAEWDSFHLEEPGYYGPRGFECIHSTLRQLFTVDNPILTDSNISPFSPDFYLRRILVPETALELIRLDLDLDRDQTGLEEAAEVLEDSRAFGKAAHAIVEDVEKERAKAREEEQRREEEAERERKEIERIEREEQEEAERLEREEEEKRIAAETPQYRQPKTLVKRPPTVPSDPSKATIPSSSSTSTASSKPRKLSPDLNDLDVVKSQPQTKPSSVPSSPSTSFLSQPKIAAFMKSMNMKESDLKGMKVKKPSSSSSSKGKESLVIDSSSEDELVIDSSPERTTKKKKRRASSPEKRRTLPSSPSPPKKRRASSPIGQSPTKKRKSKPASTSSSKSQRATSPIKDQTNSQAGRTELEKALADCSSDLESDIETNFGAKNRKLEEEKKKRKKEAANEARKRTIKEKQRQAEIEKEKEKRAKLKKTKGK